VSQEDRCPCVFTNLVKKLWFDNPVHKSERISFGLVVIDCPRDGGRVQCPSERQIHLISNQKRVVVYVGMQIRRGSVIRFAVLSSLLQS
jgi:hypothetical protein